MLVELLYLWKDKTILLIIGAVNMLLSAPRSSVWCLTRQAFCFCTQAAIQGLIKMILKISPDEEVSDQTNFSLIKVFRYVMLQTQQGGSSEKYVWWLAGRIPVSRQEALKEKDFMPQHDLEEDTVTIMQPKNNRFSFLLLLLTLLRYIPLCSRPVTRCQ